MRKLFFTFLALSVISTTFSQVTFEKSYPFYMGYGDVVFAQDDGYLMALIGIKQQQHLFTLIKTDLNGDTLWTRDFDMGLQHTTDVIGTIDEAGDMYFIFSEDTTHLIKVSETGNLLWSRYTDGYFTEIQWKNDILWMCSQGCYLYKIDPATGNTLWKSNRFAFEDWFTFVPTSLSITDDNEVVITVSQMDIYMGFLLNSEFFRLTENTDTVEQFYPVFQDEYLLMDSEVIDNEIYSIGGLSQFNSQTNVMVKYLIDGTVLSESRYVYPFNVGFYKMVINNDQITGLGGVQSSTPILLHSMSLNGDSLWTQFLGSEVTYGFDLNLAADGGYVISGNLENNSGSQSYPYLFKTNSMGIITNQSIVESHNFTISPNPAKNLAVLKTEGISNGTVTIISTTGQIISQIPVTGLQTTLDLSKFQPGVYICTVNSVQKNGVCKLVVE